MNIKNIGNRIFFWPRNLSDTYKDTYNLYHNVWEHYVILDFILNFHS